MATIDFEDEFELEEYNRTGIMTHPELSAQLIRGATESVPSSDGDATELTAQRAEYIEEAFTIGSPPEALINENATDVADGFAVLLDKLGERLAFERQGVRLYETLMQKLETSAKDGANGPSLGELRHICEEELAHFHLLQKAITSIGGDGTVLTPSADVAGVLSYGILQVVADPRTSIKESLQAMLNAELADNDGWQMLKDLALALRQTDLAEQCDEAFKEEQEHLENVRQWLSSMVLDEAKTTAAEAAGLENKKSRKRNGGRKRQKSSGKKKK